VFSARRVRRLGAAATLVVHLACSASTNPAPTVSRSGSGSVASSSARPGSAGEGNWPTYHADAARSGAVRGPSLADVRHVWTSPDLDGDIYAEPLVAGSHVIASTENNSVYALDASTGAVVWRTNLGEPVDSSTLPCGNISPTSGITGTSVVDQSSGVLYVAAFLSPAAHELFALEERTGSIMWHRSIDPPGMDPHTQQLRAALTLANDTVYAAFGGLFGDCGEYHGWVVGAATDGSGPLLTYEAPTVNAGGIWAPSGAAVDGAGNLYVTTGNSFSGESFDHSDSVIKLAPDLRELGFFAPENWQELNDGDVDLGSVGPAVLRGGRIFQIGKEGVGYLVDGEQLGGIGGELSSLQLCASAFGGTAHTSDAIYVPCTDGLAAVGIAPDGASMTQLWRSATFDAGPPIVAGGLVWTVDLSNGALVGLDASDGREVVRQQLGDVSHFASPSSAMGCVFVPTLTTITAFCLAATG
jgi:outer membrane protein assembly factor BamB